MKIQFFALYKSIQRIVHYRHNREYRVQITGPYSVHKHTRAID